MKIGLQTWGSDGDIRPFLALAGALRARGHDVSLVLTSVDNKDYRSFGREMDFPVSQVGVANHDGETLLRFRDEIIKATNSLKQVELILEYFYTPLIPEMFEAAEKLCREHDVIVGHFLNTVVQTAAEKAGKPYVTVMMSHLSVYSKYSPVFGVPDIGRWMNPCWWRLMHFAMDRLLGVEVNRLRAQVGLPRVKHIAETVMISKRLNLIAETSALAQRQPDWPDYHQVCGAFTLPDSAEPWTMPDDLKKFMENGEPPVFIGLGSMFSIDTEPAVITKILVDAAMLAGCRAIVQAPWDRLPEFPGHRRIYKLLKAPHRHIFPRCAAIVHHGGAGTTHAALLHGCPSIVIEHIADQAFFGAELHRLGVAPKVLHRRTITAKKLAQAIKSVLDDQEMKKRAETVREVMLKEKGAGRAAELIEERCRNCWKL